MIEQAPPPAEEQDRIALMVEILHAYRARNLARARGDTGAAASAHHHLMVLLDRLGSAGARTRPESSKHLGRGSLAP